MQNRQKISRQKRATANISYPSSAAAVVFSVHLSAQIDRMDANNLPPRVASYVGGNFTKPTATKQTDKIIERLNEL